MENFTDTLIEEYESDIYSYDTEADLHEYVAWLKHIGAWDQLTDKAQKEVLNGHA